MTRDPKSLRTPLGRVKALGSAKEGVQHWWLQRVTALALLVLSLYAVTGFFDAVVFGGYSDALSWLQSPFSATLIIVFLVAGFYHAVLGLQVVIEDYVHSEGLKIASLFFVKLIATLFATLGVLAALRMLFMGAR